MLVLLHLAERSGACQLTEPVHDSEPVTNSAILQRQQVLNTPLNHPKCWYFGF